MAEQKKLWKMKKESLWIDFFQWMWGIHAPSHYKTACPYYWQYAGSMVIFPFIILAKLLKFLIKPINGWMESYAEIQAKKYVAKLRLQFDNAEFDGDYYSIYKSKCYQKYKYDLWDIDVHSENRDKVNAGYMKFVEYLKNKKAVKQLKIDNFKYGAGGTILSYVFGIGVLGLLGWGVYEILHLFTMGQFVDFLIGGGILVSIVLIIWGVVALFRSMVKRFWCDSWIYKITFWKYIGMFFVMIWTGIQMFFSMIKSIYTKSCPVIDWE